jgi:hypothetical protein
MFDVHANTPLREMLLERLGMTSADATFWDDVTPFRFHLASRFEEVEEWLRTFPSRTVQDWYLVPLEMEVCAEYAAAGFTPAQVDELLLYLWEEDEAGQLTEESLVREEAWRKSGLKPSEAMRRLRNGEDYPS